MRAGYGARLRGMETPPTPVDLAVQVKDFGPIMSAAVRLRPLTVFIGPNNSGKSYAAMLLRALFASYPFPRRSSGMVVTDMQTEPPEDALSYIEEALDELGGGAASVEVDPEFMRLAEAAVLDGQWCDAVQRGLRRTFSSELTDLCRLPRRSFTVGFESDGRMVAAQLTGEQLRVADRGSRVLRLRFDNLPNGPPGAFRVAMQDDLMIIGIALADADAMREQVRSPDTWDKGEVARALGRAALRVLERTLLGTLDRPCHYLPAARSGMIQIHRALAAYIIQHAPPAGRERPDIPRLPGVVSDFVARMVDLPLERTSLYELTRSFEMELIEGEIVLENEDQRAYPEIVYQFRDTQIPLHRASSTVSELAPLFLYLKYLVEPGSVLIIEEPEAHLHPQNQRRIARLLARLVREGVNVLVTTHSEFLLGELSTLVQLSAVEPSERSEKHSYAETDFLRPEEVGTYLFRRDGRSGAYKTAELEVTVEDGIPEEEFLRVHETMYEEAFRIQQSVASEG